MLVMLLGCDALVNRLSFFPDRTHVIRDASALPAGTRPVALVTDDHERLACFLLQSPGAGRLVVYFHGNAGNIDERLPELARIRDLGVNVLGVSYRGYGASTGSPTEQGIYTDGRAAYAFARDSLHYAPGRIVLFGRSLGTTVAVNTAQNEGLAGVILVTPLTTGKEFARARGLGPFSSMVRDRYDNLSKCRNLRAPVLVIHGTGDEVIPFFLGKRLYDAAPGKKWFASIPKGGHNNLETVDSATYWGAIKDFITTKD